MAVMVVQETVVVAEARHTVQALLDLRAAINPGAAMAVRAAPAALL
jgi:hypothetical protein